MPSLLTDGQVESGRVRIVNVAERQAVTLGMGRLSMHSIARELGWTATALYRYFKNKNAIIAAARTLAYDRLSTVLEAAMTAPGDLWTRSRAVGDAYVKFAFDNPHSYKLIFDLSQPDQAQYPELIASMARARANMTRYVEQMVDEDILDADPILLGHTFWAGIHGVITLVMSGQLDDNAPTFDTIRHDMVRRLIQTAVSNKPDAGIES